MKYENNKIVYEVGDWVTRIRDEHLDMCVGDTDRVVDIFSSASISLQRFTSDSGGGSHENMNFRPATQEEINKATEEEKVFIDEYEVVFYNQDKIKVGCVTIREKLFLKIGKKAGWL